MVFFSFDQLWEPILFENGLNAMFAAGSTKEVEDEKEDAKNEDEEEKDEEKEEEDGSRVL